MPLVRRAPRGGEAAELFVPTVVGSMPKPAWLWAKGGGGGPGVQVGGSRTWAASGAMLAAAQDDATRLAVLAQEGAGVEIVSDGEQRRSDYIIGVQERMGGFDMAAKAKKSIRNGRATVRVPRCVGPITHPGAGGCVVGDLRFLKSVATQRVKVALPAAMTLCDSTANEHYATEREMGLAWAAAMNAEAHLLAENGADIVQFDEPCASRYPDKLREWGIEALNRCCEGLEGKCRTAVHVCYGYPTKDTTRDMTSAPVKGDPRAVHDVYGDIIQLLETSKVEILALEFAGPGLPVSHLRHCPSKTVMFGAVFNGGTEAEAPEEVAARLLAAAEYLPPSRLMVAPDCGLVPLHRTAGAAAHDLAHAKLRNMVAGCDIARGRWLAAQGARGAPAAAATQKGKL